MTAPLSGAIPAFSSAYALAEEAWFAGDFRGAVATLEHIVPRTATQRADVSLLMARSYLRLGLFDRALENARGVRVAADLDRQATAHLLEAAALSRLNRLDEAGAMLLEVAVLPRVHRTIAAEALLERGRIAYQRRDAAGELGECRRLAVESIGKANDIVLARAQELLGFVNLAEQKYGDAATSFREALTTLHGSGRRDALLEANILQPATALAAERSDVAILPIAVEAHDRIPWSADMRDAHFHVAQNIGWLTLIAGESPQSWRWFHDCIGLAGADDALHAIACINFAVLHRVLGESFSASQYLDRASLHMERVDWANVDADRRMAYLEWAIEAKRQGREVRPAFVERFSTFPAGIGLKALDKDDPRVQAMYQTARGLVLWKDSDARRAKRALTSALSTWNSLGFSYRAAALALDLHARTQDRAFLDFAADQSAGPLRAQIAGSRRRESRGAGDLSAAERQVLKEILAGKSGQQIADDSGRSLQTVKNHTRRIFQVMNVKSRAQLFALCTSLGITKSD